MGGPAHFARIVFLALLVIAPWGTALLADEEPAATRAEPEPLPGTTPLEWEGDLAEQMVDGMDRFLLGRLEQAAQHRAAHWTDVDADTLRRHRERLTHILGVRDPRVPFASPETVGTLDRPASIATATQYRVVAVRWLAVGDVTGEGLLLTPFPGPPVARIVFIPDADQSPEMQAGVVPGLPPEQQIARRLVESGCQVLVPLLVDRTLEPRGGRAVLTSREFLYRPAYELGRHLIGYELQKVLAGVDWMVREEAGRTAPVGVAGWGEGGMLALYASALDERVTAAYVSGYFDERTDLWQEPMDRNVFGRLERFGDAELARMIAPRTLVVEASRGPELTLPSNGGAPGRLVTPALERVEREVARARGLMGDDASALALIVSGDGTGPAGTPEALERFLKGLAPDAKLRPVQPDPVDVGGPPVDPAPRRARQQHEIDRHNQWLLGESASERQAFMERLDTSSPEAYARTIEPYRQLFRDEIIGRFDLPLLDPNPRSRVVYREPKWTGYEVVLDVFPDVFAYGILLVPSDLREGERRPVVVCQHGLEGRPQDVVAGDHRAYHDFAAKLAERGFIVFAPQNPYIFKDRFRTLQRKANPLGKTLFSLIVPQHEQIVRWLQSLPGVDPARIGFYGLSYGGKTAMRVPALVDGYALSICSADFNEWVWKNASTRSRYSYVWTGEYEIFEFDLGSTFNYAEMAALIAPRPFMVERGHFDGVAPDEAVAYEYAKVRHLYAARLGIPERTRIEWFAGPHTIHGVGTFEFLHEHLDWPTPR